MKKTFWLILYLSIIGVLGSLIYINEQTYKENNKIRNTYKSYYDLLVRWFYNKKQNIYSYNYLKQRGYNNVGIYGFGTLSEILLDELKSSTVNIKFIVDKNGLSLNEIDIPVIFPESISQYYDSVDAIIIAPVGNYDEIYDQLKSMGFSDKAVSLSDIIFNF